MKTGDQFIDTVTDENEWRRFAAEVREERRTFPLDKIRALAEMPPGLQRVARAIPLLPHLIRMAARCITSRWQTGTPPSYFVNVICREGFFSAHCSEGRWYTRSPDGKEHELHDVSGWYSREGSLVEPWHESTVEP
jgi:hypothetical protein